MSSVLQGAGTHGAAAVASVAACVALLCTNCDVVNHDNLTAHKRDTDFATAADRVKFVGRYVKMRGPVQDAMFDVDYHDNGGLVPGPSDWTILVVLKMPPEQIDSWLVDAQPVGPASATSIEDEGKASAWGRLASDTEHFRRDSTRIDAHRPEGVLVLFNSNSPHLGH